MFFPYDGLSLCGTFFPASLPWGWVSILSWEKGLSPRRPESFRGSFLILQSFKANPGSLKITPVTCLASAR
jgi:hypothetical protein